MACRTSILALRAALLVLGLVVAACAGGSSGDPESDGAGAPTVANVPSDTEPTAVDAVGATDGATSSDGTAGDVTDASGSPEALAFCGEYEQTCGFGEELFFESKTACIAAYDTMFDAERRACVEDHVDRAAMDKMTHCPHAAGMMPCD